MSGWRTWCWPALAGLAGMVAAACGSQTHAASQPKGNFPVIASASFPTAQRLSAHTQLVIRVTNAGRRTVPDVAVTITDGIPSHPDWGTQVQAFNYLLRQSDAASHSRPVWVVDQGPGPCQYSCHNGGPGGAIASFSNTWALGPLKPHKTAVFSWHLTPVQPGAWVVNWRVAAGLFGDAKAVTPDGGVARGSLTVHVIQVPAQSYVNDSGKIVTTANGKP